MEHHRNHRKAQAHSIAVGLGWLSIGLGIAELVLAPAMARAFGMRGQSGLIRLYGLREIANGIGLLAAKDKAPWLWGRVAGDALDIATLGSYVDGNRRKENVALALGAVAGVTALDVYDAQALGHAQPRQPVRDYSNRSGFPMGADAARGLAMRDFESPRDMRIPESMRPH